MKASKPRSGSASGRLLAWAPVIVFLAWTAIYYVGLSRYLASNIAPVIVQAAARALNRQITVQRLVVFGVPGTVTLQGVRVSNHPTFAQDRGVPFVVAKQVVIHYSPTRLFGQPAGSPSPLGDIDIDGATGYVERLSKAKFNFSDLIPRKPNKNGAPYLAVISVRNSILLYRDQTSPSDYRNQIEVFNKVVATVDLRSRHQVGFDARGSSPIGLFKMAHVTGDVLRNADPKVTTGAKQGFRIRAVLASARAPFFVNYLLGGIRPWLRVESGVADADVTISKLGSMAHGPLDVQGTVVVTGGRVEDVKRAAFKTPIDDVAGAVYFNLRGATFRGTASTNGIPIALDGSVFGFPQVHLALAASSESVAVARLPGAFKFVPSLVSRVYAPLPGAIALTAVGPINDLQISGSASLAQATVSGTKFTDIRSNITYAHGLVVFKTITAQHDSTGGSLVAAGLIDTRTKPVTTSFSGHLDGVRLAGLPLSPQTLASAGPVSGTGNVDFLFGTGQSGGAGGRLRLAANYAMRDVVIHGYALPSVAGRADWTEGYPLRLTDMVARDADGGIVYTRGSIPVGDSPNKRLDLSVNAVRFNLQTIASVFGISGASGEAFFSGHVGGTTASPEVSGRLALVSPRYQSYALDLGAGQVHYANDRMTLSGVQLDLDPAVATVNGSISRISSGNPIMALDVALGRAELADLVAIIPRSAFGPKINPEVERALDTATGTLDSHFIVAGTSQSPDISGNLALWNATVDNYEIDDAKGAFKLAGNVLTVPSLLVHWQDASIQVHGSYDISSTKVAAAFNATGLDTSRIAQVTDFAAVPVSGIVSMSGTVDGMLSNPHITASAQSQRLNVADLEIATISASAELANGVLTNTTPVSVSIGDSNYVITAYKFDPTTGEIGLSAHLDHTTIANLIQTIRGNPYLAKLAGNSLDSLTSKLPGPIDGSVSIPQFNVVGSKSHPAVNLVADVTNLVVGDDHINSVHADLAYVDDTITINALKALGNEAYLSAYGSVNLGGKIDAHIEASGIPLSAVNPFMPASEHVSGTIGDLTVVASGSTSSPSLVASLTLDKPAVGAFSFDRIESGRIGIDGHQISIDGVTAIKDEPVAGGGAPIEHIASLRGTLPFSWNAAGQFAPSVPPAEPIELHASIPQQNLSVLSLFFPKVAPQNLTGTITANVDLGGTLAQKNLSGNIVVANGAFSPAGLSTGLKKIDLNVTFRGNHAVIQTATAESTAGDTPVLVNGKLKSPDKTTPRGGKIDVTGSLTFGQTSASAATGALESLLGGVHLNLVANATKFAVYEPSMAQYGDAGVSGIADGSVTITDGVLSPNVTGAVKVSNLIGTLPTATPGAIVVPPPPLINPHFHSLSLSIASLATIKAPQLQAGVTGAFSLNGSLDKPYLHGSMVVQSGSFDLPTNRFRLTPGGTVEITYDPQIPGDIQTGLDEKIDITAHTVIHVSPEMLVANLPGVGAQARGQSTFLMTSGDINNQRYTVTIHVHGDLNDPEKLNLDFESDPPGLSQQQILAALGGSDFEALAGGDVQGAAKSYIAEVLTNSISGQIANRFGLDDFSIDYSPDAPLSLTVSKQITKRLDFTFVRFVNSRSSGAVATTLNPLEYQVELGYNLTNSLKLRLSTDDQRDNYFGVESGFHF